MRKIAFLLCLTTIFLSSCISLRGTDETPTQVPITTPSEGTEHYSYVDNVKPDEAATDTLQEPIEKAEINDPYFNTDISFVAVGDNLIHALIWLDAEKRGSAEKHYDFLPLYEHIADDVAEADVAFINQETIMAGEKYGYTAYPTFNSPQQLGLDLITLGFDIVNVASNHMLDKGESGYRDMLNFWHEHDDEITMIGGYYNKADHDNIRVTEVDGVKIAWLAYTYNTNYISLPAGSEMYIPYIYTNVTMLTGLDKDLVTSDVTKAKELADVVIVSLHMGTEYTHTPNADQIEITQHMADLGVDVILGHHSHCLQPVKWLDGADGNKTLCIYSMGNIASGQTGALKLVGGMFKFRIVGDGEGGLKVVDPILEPTIMHYGWDYMNTKIYPLDMYTDELASTHGMGNPNIHGGGITVAEAIRIVKGCIDEEFLPAYLK